MMWTDSGVRRTRRKADGDFLAGGSNLGDSIGVYHWEATPLGPLSGCPEPLRVAVSDDKHPGALRRPLSETCRDVRPVVESTIEKVRSTGQPLSSRDRPNFYRRDADREERYCTNRNDLPFALLYVVDQDHKRATLAASAGLRPRATASPQTIDWAKSETPEIWPYRRTVTTNSVQQVDDLHREFEFPTAILVGGVSRHRAPDDAYRGFLDSVANLIASTIMRVMADNSLALREIVDLIPVMIGVMRPDISVLYANQAILDYTGPSMEEALEPDASSRGFHPEDTARLRDKPRVGLLGNKPFKLDDRIRHKERAPTGNRKMSLISNRRQTRKEVANETFPRIRNGSLNMTRTAKRQLARRMHRDNRRQFYPR